MRPIELSPRLRAVGNLVPPGSRYADVGTDHAYLPVWLLQKGVINRAIASDLREGPLERARQTAARYGLTDRLDFRLCNGLAALSPHEVDTVSIAGMGGETIADILAATPWAAQGDRRFLLQPMSGVEELRAYLNGHGFCIAEEALVQEERTLYLVLLAVPGTEAPYTPAQLWAGRQRPPQEQPMRGVYLDRLLLRATRALAGARASNKPEDAARAKEFEAIYSGLCDMKKEWDAWSL